MGTGRLVDQCHPDGRGDGVARGAAGRHLRADGTEVRHGVELSSARLEELRGRIARAGFTRWIRARGLWVLANGQPQVEDIWIGRADCPNEQLRAQLPELAAFLKKAANQEAVAWEELGELRFL